MKPFIKISATAGIVLFLVFSAGWSQEFDYTAYTHTTLQDVIAEDLNHSNDQPKVREAAYSIQLECTVAKYRVLCGYSNARRRISAEKKYVIRLWMETLGIDPDLSSLYWHEILVSEGSSGHWIPVQEQLFPSMKQELIKNSTIELFIIFIGKADSEFVFIATEFQKKPVHSRSSIQTTVSKGTAPWSYSVQ